MTIQTQLLEAIKESNLVKAQDDKVKTRKLGVYSQFTAIASESGQEAFEVAVTEVFEAIKANTDGVAVATKCKAGKKEGTYTVPSAAMSAKSTLLSAFKYGVTMLDDESDAPRAFSAIRDDVKVAKQIESEAGRTEAQETRDNVALQLEALAEVLREQDVDDVMADSMARLSVVLDSWQDEHAALSGDDAQQEAA